MKIKKEEHSNEYTRKVHKAIREIKSLGPKELKNVEKVCNKYKLKVDNIIKIGQFKCDGISN